jgi:hypothetical protein
LFCAERETSFATPEHWILSQHASALQQANDYVQNDGQQDTEDNGGDNGKVAGESFALDGNVTGQSPYVGDLVGEGQDQPDDKDEPSQNQQHFADALKGSHFPFHSPSTGAIRFLPVTLS